MKRIVAVASSTLKKAKKLSAGLPKIENSTESLFFGNFQLFLLESMILSPYLAAIFKKIYQHARPVISFESGVTLVFPPKRKRVQTFLFHFESQNI